MATRKYIYVPLSNTTVDDTYHISSAYYTGASAYGMDKEVSKIYYTTTTGDFLVYDGWQSLMVTNDPGHPDFLTNTGEQFAPVGTI